MLPYYTREEYCTAEKRIALTSFEACKEKALEFYLQQDYKVFGHLIDFYQKRIHLHRQYFHKWVKQHKERIESGHEFPDWQPETDPKYPKRNQSAGYLKHLENLYRSHRKDAMKSLRWALFEYARRRKDSWDCQAWVTERIHGKLKERGKS